MLRRTIQVNTVSGKVHYAHLIQRKLIAQETEEFIFSGVEPLFFRPGQFISIQVGIDAQQNPILRSYSIASFPGKKEFSLILKMGSEGTGTQFFQKLNFGDSLRFTGPMGFFVNELIHEGDVLYAATGTGFAAIYPMLQETLQRKEEGRVFLFWGVRYPEELFYAEELKLLSSHHSRLESKIFVTRPPSGFTGNTGRIINPILQKFPSLQVPIFYLCGNGQMIKELKEELQTRGVNRKRQIRTEAFFE